MKICIYIPYINQNSGGLFPYALAVIKMLVKSDQISKVILIISEDQKEFFEAKFSKVNKLNIKVVRIEQNWLLNFLNKSYKFLLDINFIYVDKKYIKDKYLSFLNPYKYYFEKLDADIIHIPFQVAPVYKINKPIITTLHDMQELHFPEYFSPAERLGRALAFKKSTELSDHIVVTFNHVKEDIIKYFQIEEQKVSVCPLNFIEDWFAENQSTTTEELKLKYSLKEPFILYPAAFWPHKNHTVLIKAFNEIYKKNKNLNLVLTGNDKTSYASKIRDIIHAYKLDENIKILGVVSNEDLVGLYKSCSLVVIPTKYEAGSGPLFEAMKFNSPVICSNVTSLPEIIGNKTFTFDPDDYLALAEMINKILNDKLFLDENLANSKSRIEFYSKIDSSKSFIDVYHKLLVR